mmetsp:Transcript_16459/g.42444  ORF Transcript_16459/g.42444 Transcript_16459/m.42444 type:complete len:365 (-) Transcript_16459:74-1168(-)
MYHIQTTSTTAFCIRGGLTFPLSFEEGARRSTWRVLRRSAVALPQRGEAQDGQARKRRSAGWPPACSPRSPAPEGFAHHIVRWRAASGCCPRTTIAAASSSRCYSGVETAWRRRTSTMAAGAQTTGMGYWGRLARGSSPRTTPSGGSSWTFSVSVRTRALGRWPRRLGALPHSPCCSRWCPPWRWASAGRRPRWGLQRRPSSEWGCRCSAACLLARSGGLPRLLGASARRVRPSWWKQGPPGGCCAARLRKLRASCWAEGPHLWLAFWSCCGPRILQALVATASLFQALPSWRCHHWLAALLLLTSCRRRPVPQLWLPCWITLDWSCLPMWTSWNAMRDAMVGARGAVPQLPSRGGSGGAAPAS